MKFPKLYKEKNNKVLWWQIETGTTVSGIPTYIVSHGYVGGATQTTSTEVPFGKNKGKKNETTAEQQCELEARSEWEKHRDRKGYVENLEAHKADTGFKPVRPMLAHKYHEYFENLDLPCYIQKKYDGICCLAHVDEKGNTRFFSRQSSEFDILGHIADEIRSLGIRSITLHGELYTHGMKFQKIISGIKRDTANELTDKINYVVYDAALQGTPYEKRLSVISSLLKPEWHSTARVKVATTQLVRSVEEIDSHYEKYVLDGYEGAILRNVNGLYVEDKRSQDLLKYKKFQDDEFEIVGAEEAKGKYKGTCRFILKTKAGAEFKAYPEGDQFHRESLWSDWNSGKIQARDIATIKFFEYTTGTNPVPRHPIFRSLRNYE